MIANLAWAGVMIVLTTGMHLVGLVVLMKMLEWPAERALRLGGRLRRGSLILAVVLGVFALHGLQIWAYALLYLALGALHGLEEALYFSASTFTTVGFGDLVLDRDWRLLSAIESANGFLLIGWSTAFLLSVTARLRTLDVDGPRATADETTAGS